MDADDAHAVLQVVHQSQLSAHKSEILETMHQFQRDGYLCDTVVVADGGKLKAHSAVLAAASPVFKRSLCPSEQPIERVIMLPGVDLYIAKIIINLAYTGCISIPKKYMEPQQVSHVMSVMKDLSLKMPTVKDRPVDESIVKSEIERCELYDAATDADISLNTFLSSLPNDHLLQTTDEQKDGDDTDSNTAELFPGKSECSPTSSPPPQPESIRTKPSRSSGGSRFVIGRKRSAPTRMKQKYKTTKSPNGFICSICGKQLNSSVGMWRHRKSHVDPNWRRNEPKVSCVCDICGMRLSEAHTLRRHVREVHCGERNFNCQLCGRTFTRANYLKDHLAASHGDQATDECGRNARPPFTCISCGEGFSTRYKLAHHRKNVHLIGRQSGGGIMKSSKPDVESPFRCPVCRLHYSSQDTLDAHILTHPTNEPTAALRASAQCSTCGKNFKSKYYMAIHMQLHTGEKPFECATCKRRFASRSMLSQHGRIHNADERRYVCETCGKRFLTRRAVVKHERVHTGEKPFECSVCGKRWAQEENMRTHMYTHMAERPHRCTVCDKAFVSRSKLRQHCVQAHGIEMASFGQSGMNVISAVGAVCTPLVDNLNAASLVSSYYPLVVEGSLDNVENLTKPLDNM